MTVSPQGITPVQAEALVCEHYAMVYRYVRALLPARVAAEDLVQQVFLVALRKLPEDPPERPKGAWLRGIARHLILAQRSGPPALSHGQQERLAEVAEAAWADRYDREILASCMDRLGPQDRELLSLRHRDDLRAEEIARQVGHSRNWVHVRLHRIHEQLRECMEKNGGQP